MTQAQTPNRETWLNSAVDILRDGVFAPLHVKIPPLKVSVGLPYGKNQRDVLIQFHPGTATSDHIPQVFISPLMHDGGLVLNKLAVLLHAHYGHKQDPVPLNVEAITLTLEVLGDYPQAALKLPDVKKQETRMLKVSCQICKYTVRATSKWLHKGIPNCPNEACPKYGSPMYAAEFTDSTIPF